MTTPTHNSEHQSLENIASQIRRDIIRMTHNAAGGHPGGAMGCTELFVALYFEIMNHNPQAFTIDGKSEDLFFLSNGHICAGLYSTLARSGYFSIDELASHRKINSRLQGHPATTKNLPGIRIASGSLGQGLSVAAGAALTKKINSDPSLVFALMGDGEQQEGQIWEASMYAAHNKIDNLIGIIDYNGAQIDGTTEDIISLKDLSSKWRSFGWEVLELKEGNVIEQVIFTLNKAKQLTKQGKPILILMHTLMGYGVDFMQGGNTWHGKATNTEETELALSQLEETLGDY